MGCDGAEVWKGLVSAGPRRRDRVVEAPCREWVGAGLGHMRHLRKERRRGLVLNPPGNLCDRRVLHCTCGVM